MQLACSTLTFGKTKTEKDFTDALDAVKSAGYRGVQIERDLLPDSLLQRPKEVRQLVTSAGLRTVAVAVTSDPYDIRFTDEVDGRIGTLCLFEKSFEEAARQIRKLLRLSSKHGVNLAVHPHVRSNVETIQSVEEILNLAPDDPNLSLVFDSAHFTALGWDIINFLRRFHTYVSIAHIKDLKRLKSPSKIDYDRDFADIGDGIVDFKELMKEFKRIRFSGWLVVEVDHPQLRTPAASARRNYEKLSRLM